MGDDWDLYAVVRSCKSSTVASSNRTNRTTTTNPPHNNINVTSTSQSQDPSPCLATFVSFKEQNHPFSFFSNLILPRPNGFQELSQLCTPLFPTTTTTDGESNNGQQHQQQLSNIVQPQHPLQYPFTRESPHQEFQTPSSSSEPLIMVQSQAPRSRKRKIQHKKLVSHVSSENMSSDMWAWRKYGQKPIKGSPYPRNYYRCSSSKICQARKQVERSTKDPDMFIVTYTGEHSHPRPTHRNSLAGSTRLRSLAKQSTVDKTDSATIRPSSLSLPTLSKLSPNSPLSTATESENEMKETEMEIEMEGDDDVLIPNMSIMADHLCQSFQELVSPVCGTSTSGSSAGDP